MKQVFLESHNIKNKFSGFGQFNYHLIKGLANLDLTNMEITLLAKNTQELREEFEDAFKYRKYHSLYRHKPFRIKKKYDLWHCLNQNIKIEPFHNIPYVLTVHDIHFMKEGPEEDRKRLKELFLKKLERCNALVYISEFAKHDTHESFQVPDIPEYVIYNGNTITDTSIPEGYKPSKQINRPFLFSIGDFSERKNFKSLVKMLPQLPEYDLVLAGNNSSDYAKSLSELAQSLGVLERVHQTGKINDLEKKYYLSECAAFLFPSHREGFGIPPIEAMRFGKPVFLSNNTSLPEIGGEHALFWDSYDPEYMVEVFKNGMQQISERPDFYKNWYIERAKSFDWNTTAAQYLEVYRTILEGKA